MNIKSRLFKRLAIYIGMAVFLSITASVIAVSAHSQSKTIETLLLEGERYLLELNYNEAIIAFEKVLKLDNKNVDAYIGLGEAYVKIGNVDEAIRILMEGYALTANERIKYKLDDIYYDLANFYINNNDLEQAALVLARGIRLTDSEVLSQLLEWINEEMQNVRNEIPAVATTVRSERPTAAPVSLTERIIPTPVATENRIPDTVQTGRTTPRPTATLPIPRTPSPTRTPGQPRSTDTPTRTPTASPVRTMPPQPTRTPLVFTPPPTVTQTTTPTSSITPTPSESPTPSVTPTPTPTVSGTFSYEIRNLANKKISLKTKSRKSFQFASYDEDGGVVSYRYRSSSSITINTGGFVVITMEDATIESLQMPAWDGMVSIREVSDPAIEAISMTAGKSYSFVNNTNKSQTIPYFGNSKQYSAVYYNSGGAITNYTDRTPSSFSISPEGETRVTLLDQDIIVHVPYNFKEVNIRDIGSSVLNTYRINANDSAIISNHTANDLSLPHSESFNKRFSAVFYNSAGRVSSYINNTTGKIKALGNSHTVITVGNADIVIYFPAEWNLRVVSFERSPEPALYFYTLQAGLIYTIETTSPTDRRWPYEGRAKYYDAIYFDGSGGMTSTTRSIADSIMVRAGGMTQVTVGDGDITIFIPYSLKDLYNIFQGEAGTQNEDENEGGGQFGPEQLIS